MKRYSFFLLLSVLLAITAQAQTRYVGYSSNDDIDIKGAAFCQTGTYTIGALLTPKQLAPYEGCRVLGIRVATALAPGRTRTFVYTLANGKMNALVEQTQRLYEGWNQVLFNGDGYQINGDETLFVGYDYKESAEMVQADQGGLCCVGDDIDGGFYLYQSDGLYQITGVGSLCVQLIVDISSLPAHDIDMTYLDTGFKYKKPGERIEALASFTNVGREAIHGFRLGYQLDDQQPVYQDEPDSLLVEGRTESWQFTCALPADCPVGLHTLKVFVCQANGLPMADRSQNDTLTASFAVYEKSLQRDKAYFEIYTDQASPYVPYLDESVALLTKNMSDILTVVNVHRPGTPLAVSEAAYLHELYAYDWPTFTTNRSYFPGEAYVAYDMNDYLPVVGADMCAGIIGDMIVQDYLNPAFANIKLQAYYDQATRQLSVETTGQLLPEAWAIYGELALTLMLVEDSVKSDQIVYNTFTQRPANNQGYLHQHVLRGFMTAPTGDVLTASDTDYMASHSMVIPAKWKTDHLTLVALLTKKADKITEDNMRDYDVINAQSLALSSVLSADGISQPTVTGSRPTTYYSLDGKPVATPRHGIYLLRESNGSMRKVIVK